MKKFIINTDGASRGNPGRAAVGFVISTSDSVIWVQEGQVIGITTNNEAEYRAIILAFERLTRDFINDLPTKVEIKADSMLITQQLAGKYKIKNEKLKSLYLKVKELEKGIGEVTYRYVPRSQNFLADKLANIALDNGV